MLRKFFLSMMVAGSFAFPLGTAAEAAIADSPFVSADHVTHVAPVEDANFVHLGIPYCWYPNGWRGAGFYECGFAWRTGFGWGGPWGWNGWGGGWRSGWNGHGWHRGMTVHHHHHHHRPGNRPGHGNNGRVTGTTVPATAIIGRVTGTTAPATETTVRATATIAPVMAAIALVTAVVPEGAAGSSRSRPGGGGGNRGGGNRGGGGGGQRRRSELPSQPKIIATATFDYASASSAPYEVVVSF